MIRPTRSDTFANAETITPHFQVGDVRLQSIELLVTGRTEPIVAGDGFVHALFHLETPSVTDLNLVLGSAGFKYNAGTNLLVNANILFPITNGGLRDTMTFAFGFEYAF